VDPRGDKTGGSISVALRCEHTWGGKRPTPVGGTCAIHSRRLGLEIKHGDAGLGVGQRRRIADPLRGAARDGGNAGAAAGGGGNERLTRRFQISPAGGAGGVRDYGGVSSANGFASPNAETSCSLLAMLRWDVVPRINWKRPAGKNSGIGNPSKVADVGSQACGKLGRNHSEIGRKIRPRIRGTPLVIGHVQALQMAEVSVDVETAWLRMEKFRRVQDCA